MPSSRLPCFASGAPWVTAGFWPGAARYDFTALVTTDRRMANEQRHLATCRKSMNGLDFMSRP